MKRVLSIILAAFLICGFSGCTPNSNKSNTPNTTNEVAQGDFSVHYIDVGQADAALVLCEGKSMLIDGGNVADSDLIYTYLQKRNIGYLDYVVCTHAHEDHVGSLPAALTAAQAGAVFAPKTGANTKAYQNFVKKAEEQGLTIQNPQPGDNAMLGSSRIDFLGPIKENTDELNNTSIVLKITYGETSFLFTGAMERDAEQDILNAGFNLSATVLKVGHHGSDTSTSYPFLREIMPQYAIISVGNDNTYGHPSKQVLSRLRDADVTVYRTDLQGDIIATSDGQTVSIQTKKNENIQTNPTAPVVETPKTGGEYIGNKKSMKFHLPSCPSLPEGQNRVSFPTREQVILDGYTPCGVCKP